jgi:opacity protein-like surface antigen
MKGLLIIAATAALLTVSACGSQKAQQATPQTSTTAPSAPAGPTIKEQANRYLAIITPANEASDRFNADYAKLDSETATRKEFDAVVKPFAAAVEKADTALLRADWSPNVRLDIRSLVDADAALAADISTAYDNPDSRAPIARDIAAFHVAANAVRADLGLPPAKS